MEINSVGNMPKLHRSMSFQNNEGLHSQNAEAEDFTPLIPRLSIPIEIKQPLPLVPEEVNSMYSFN